MKSFWTNSAWLLILVVGLAVVWREAPDAHRLASQNSNDGVVAVHLRAPVPTSFLKLGRRVGQPPDSAPQITGQYQEVIARWSASSLFNPVLSLIQVQRE